MGEKSNRRRDGKEYFRRGTIDPTPPIMAEVLTKLFSTNSSTLPKSYDNLAVPFCLEIYDPTPPCSARPAADRDAHSPLDVPTRAEYLVP